ncbi:hypothetical protein RFI_04478 [Reticulomyxa filosa]|uniref:Uncharacterized protein n=1 Tax=Reticulomyxa filosa TaxID=46433 RepID=X6P3H5_RETFI|nr:hypothetical protein RFI_04478 [Reticulomyxa filosa]|eukprot:ETO32639.1 hypothetical protein RFI_04478 [Reticulomyxa filosa]
MKTRKKNKDLLKPNFLYQFISKKAHKSQKSSIPVFFCLTTNYSFNFFLFFWLIKYIIIYYWKIKKWLYIQKYCKCLFYLVFVWQTYIFFLRHILSQIYQKKKKHKDLTKRKIYMIKQKVNNKKKYYVCKKNVNSGGSGSADKISSKTIKDTFPIRMEGLRKLQEQKLEGITGIGCNGELMLSDLHLTVKNIEKDTSGYFNQNIGTRVQMEESK